MAATEPEREAHGATPSPSRAHPVAPADQPVTPPDQAVTVRFDEPAAASLDALPAGVTDEGGPAGDTGVDDSGVEDSGVEESGDDEEESEGSRFAELVEERVRRGRYAHHLTRTVFTPTEAATSVVVERRAAIWVPTLTFVATLVSAAAAVVLATRLHGDPADPTGHQLLVVTITVCLLAAAFGILLRAEVHYERLRPRGRTVRHDVADAYEIVRDAPRRLVRLGAPVDVLRRVSDLLPAAEQLVDALVAYAAEGGNRVREHPAYDRIVRMRAEVEVIELMLAERAAQGARTTDRGPGSGRSADRRAAGVSDFDVLPRPEQVPDFAGLQDLADQIQADRIQADQLQTDRAAGAAARAEKLADA
jgi:hypothetical protein